MKMTLLVSLIFGSSIAYAYSETAQNLIPAASQSEFIAGALYQSVDGTGSVSVSNVTYDASLKTTGYVTPFSYYYGISESGAIGAQSRYASSSTDTNVLGNTLTDKSKGLSDITVSYKGNAGGDSLTGFYELGTSVPPEKLKVNRDTKESNESSGRFKPFLSAGLVAPVGVWLVGAKAGYTMALDGDGEYTSGGIAFNGTIKNGSEYSFSIFGELPSVAHLNAELQYSRSYNSTFTSNDGNYVVINHGQEQLGLILQSRIALTSNFELLPAVMYQTILNKSELHIDTLNQVAAAMILRSVF